MLERVRGAREGSLIRNFCGMFTFVATIAFLVVMHWVNFAKARKEALFARRQMEVLKRRLQEKRRRQSTPADDKFFDIIFARHCKQYFRRRWRSMMTLLQEFRI